MESDYHWLVTVGLVTSSVIAVTTNFFLLVVFCRRRGLRTVPNRFVINLLITNLLSSILLIPLLLVDQDHHTSTLTNSSTSTTFNSTHRSLRGFLIQEEILSSSEHLLVNDNSDIELIETSERVLTERFSLIAEDNEVLLCYFAQGTTSFVCTASIFSILLIGINQYFGVIHSLRYHFYINKCRLTIFIVSSWVAALFCAILSSLTFSDSSLWHFCDRPRSTSDTLRILNTIYAFTYFIVIILAPFVGICVIYVCIYTAAHQNSERMRKSTSAALNAAHTDYIEVPVDSTRPSESDSRRASLPKVHSAPNFSQLDKRVGDQNNRKVKRTISERSTASFITNLKHKISNASVFRYREETRAAKISILVIFMVLICYLPYGVTLVLSSDCIQINPSQVFNYLSLILLVFSNIISPFLFGYRNKRVKREIGKMFGLVPISNQKLNNIDRQRKRSNIIRNRSFEEINEAYENNSREPFLQNKVMVPEVIVSCKVENERKSILKRVCNSSSWNYKKCNFITVPDSCLGEARGSFSSASTQISSEE